MSVPEIQAKVAIAAAGIDRFYDEGFTEWSEEKFRVLFAGAALEEPAIQRVLDAWEVAGAIVRGRPDCFVEIRRPVAGIVIAR